MWQSLQEAGGRDTATTGSDESGVDSDGDSDRKILEAMQHECGNDTSCVVHLDERDSANRLELTPLDLAASNVTKQVNFNNIGQKHKESTWDLADSVPLKDHWSDLSLDLNPNAAMDWENLNLNWLAELDAKSTSGPPKEDQILNPAAAGTKTDLATEGAALPWPLARPTSQQAGHHNSVTVLLKLQHNGTSGAGSWLPLDSQGGPVLAGLLGGGGLLLLLVLFALGLVNRNRRNTKSFSVPSNCSSLSSVSQGRGSKDSIVVVTAAAVGHEARLLPKIDSSDLSPFDKDFSFDFSTSICEGGGYHPTPYRLDPPCSSVPPCPSPCKCWEKEEDSGVGAEDSAGSNLCGSDDTERDGSGSRFAKHDKMFYLDGELLKGFSCLRVAPSSHMSDHHSAVQPSTITSSPSQSFTSFKSKSNSRKASRSNSIPYSANHSVVSSPSLSLILHDRNATASTPLTSGRYGTAERSFTNNNKLQTNFNNSHNTSTSIQDIASISTAHCASVITGDNHSHCTSGTAANISPSAGGTGKHELMLSLSSDLGFSEVVSPAVSPIRNRCTTLPSLKKNLKYNSLKFHEQSNGNYSDSFRGMNSSVTVQFSNIMESPLCVKSSLSNDSDTKDSIASDASFTYCDEVQLVASQKSGFDERTCSLPAWVRAKKAPLVTEDDQAMKEPNWCKKQRNRMRSDAAQIIALSQSRALEVVGSGSLVTSLVADSGNPQITSTVTLGQGPQQAVVVYKERTAL